MFAKYYNAEDKYDELCEWYGGYQFGNSELFNPWSVINYFRNKCTAGAYWQSTGGNGIIGEIIKEADSEILNRFTALLQGKSFTTYFDTGVIYPQLKNNPSSIYSYLLMTGYLRVTKSTLAFNGDFMCEVSLPNKEISFVYVKEVLKNPSTLVVRSTALAIQEAVFSGNFEKLKSLIQTLLIQSADLYDAQNEFFYHGLLLGLYALFCNAYVILDSELDGIYVIRLKPKKGGLPGIVIVLKAEKNCGGEELKKSAENALARIDEKEYAQKMIKHRVSRIYKYGAAFNGKNVEVAVAENLSKLIVEGFL